MNELERLVAAIVRPKPSTSLDMRVKTLLDQTPAPPSRARWRRVATLCASAACIGLAGFYLGWESGWRARSTDPQTPTIAQATGSPAAPNSTHIPLTDDQLASLFMRSASHEGLLGRGPVEIQIPTSP